MCMGSTCSKSIPGPWSNSTGYGLCTHCTGGIWSYGQLPLKPIQWYARQWKQNSVICLTVKAKFGDTSNGNLSPGPQLLVLPKTHRRLGLWKRSALLPRLLLWRSVRLGNRYHDEFLYLDVLLIFKIMYLYIYCCYSFWFAIIHCRKHSPKSRVILRNSAWNTASHSKAHSIKLNFYLIIYVILILKIKN